MQQFIFLVFKRKFANSTLYIKINAVISLNIQLMANQSTWKKIAGKIYLLKIPIYNIYISNNI